MLIHKAQTKIRDTLFKGTNLNFVKFMFNLLTCILKTINKLRRLGRPKKIRDTFFGKEDPTRFELKNCHF